MDDGRLASGGGIPPGGDSWQVLARLAGVQPGTDAPGLAAALQRSSGDERSETELAGALRLLVEEPPYGREAMASELVAALGARGLAPLLRRFAGDVPARRRLILAAGRNLTPDAAARLVLAAAVAWDRPCSRPFMEVLAKLTRAANAGDAGCDTAIRGLMRLVADRWGDVSADSSSYTYDDMVETAQRTPPHPQAYPEPERLIELAVELDTLTGETWRAVGDMVDTGRLPELLAILRRAPRGSRAAEGVVQHVATPGRLRSLLDQEPIDYAALDALVPALGISAAEPLLDRLAQMQSREERQPLVDRVSSLGPAAASLVVARLDDPSWYTQANMLAVLRTWKLAPESVSLKKHGAHADARVRRETLQLLLEADPGRRDEAILLGLRDHDPQNVHMVLQSARGACPARAVNALSFLVEAPTTPPFLRLPAIRLLGELGSSAALDVLLRLVDGGSSLLGRRKLAPKSSEMLAALASLRGYRGDKRAAELLAAAESSRDDELRATARG
jgi:hypothetical protein